MVGDDTQKIDNLLELTKKMAPFEGAFFEAKSLQERIEATTNIQRLVEEGKSLEATYKYKFSDLFTNLNAAEKEFLEAKTRDEKSEAKGKLDGFVQQIQRLNRKYRFECPELQQFIEEKRKFQRAPTARISNAIAQNLQKFLDGIAKLSYFEKKISELSTEASDLYKNIEGYKKALIRSRNRTLVIIIAVGLVIGGGLYYSSRGLVKQVKEYIRETKGLRSELKTANQSLAQKIAHKTDPLEARLESRINELYAMAQDVECEQEFLMEGYNSFAASVESLKGKLTSLENAAGEDRQKYAPLVDEVAKLNATIIELNKTAVDKKYFEDKMKEILDLYLIIKKRSDKDAGGNYTP